MSSVAGWREAGHLTTTAWRWYELVLVRRAQGRLDAAVLTCQRALDSLVTSGRPPPAAGPGYVGLAEIAYQRDELDLALRHASKGIALCRQFVHTTPLANGLAALAMIRQATGDPAGALEAITEAGQASPGPAGCSIRSRPSGPGCCWPRATCPARPVSRRTTASARTTSRPTPANPGTWCWPGAARPGPAGQAAAGVPLGYLARLQRAFGSGQPASDPVPAGIVDPLTSREVEVLEMLAAGRSNQAIARELVVTLDTVKKHVGHVLGKLGAANRTEAVARARELNLIP